MNGEAPHVELQTSDYPDLDPSAPSNVDEYANGMDTSQKIQDTKAGIMNSAQSTFESIQNHPTTQNMKQTVSSSPLGQSVQNQGAKASSEFRDIADAKRVPDQPAATGQPLTNYHSMFYRLLSWKNPRATGISFATAILFIFAARYLHIMRYVFKSLYIVLGTTAAAEIAGHTILGKGLVSQIRPRRYFTIPKESLERFLDDFEQLINFFVIEFQRILFAENVYVTVGSFLTSLIAYLMVKWVPLWGLSLIGTSVIYLAPLIYISNKEFIDTHLAHASDIASQQATQFKDMAAHHTGRASESVKSYASEYTSKAQGMMGSRSRPTSPEAASSSAPVKTEAFPDAPQHDPVVDATSEPLQAA